jgi:multicomponent Na+:H+ antiporter subunit F
VVALDMLVGIVIGFIAVTALRTGYTLYVDIAIALGLVGFLATVAFARFILVRGNASEAAAQGPSATGKVSADGKPAGKKLPKAARASAAANKGGR